MITAEERAAIEKEVREKIKAEERAKKAARRRNNKNKIAASNKRYWQKLMAMKALVEKGGVGGEDDGSEQ